MAALHSALREHAVPLDSRAFDDLIDEVVGDRRVVALGESHHFVHETYAIRSRVLRSLAGIGFAHVGFEIARTDGARLDDALSGRDPNALDRVSTFGYRHPDDRPYEGVLAVAPGVYPEAGMRAEYASLLDALRASLPPESSWRAFGFDIDYAAGAAAERLAELELSDAAERVRATATLSISRRYDDAVRAASSYDALRTPMAWREQLMAEHVEFELAAHPDGRFALCAHNLHLAAYNPALDVPGAVGPGGGEVPPLGAALAAAGHRVATIWMLHADGVDCGPPPSNGRVRAPRATLNRALAAFGTSFAFRTDSIDELARPWRSSTIYDTVIEGVPAQQCDVIVFVANTTALRTT